MKKLFFLVLISGCFINILTGKPGKSWVASDAGRVDAVKVEVGTNKAKIILANGEKESIPLNELNSYSIDGKVFNKLEFYKNGKPTGQMVFMELVKTRGDYSLYKYEYWDDDLIKSYEKVKTAYLYNGDKLQMQVDEQTLPDVCNFFGLKAVIE